MARETIIISSVASPEQQINTIGSVSNEPTIPHGFGKQQPIVQPSLNDLNLAPNLFNVLATLAVIQPDDENSPQSPELSHPSPVSTPAVNLNTIEGWETAHTASNDNTFCSEDEPRRVYWDKSSTETFDHNEPRQVSLASSPSSIPPPPPRQKRKLRIGIFFPKNGECRSTRANHAASRY